LTKPLMVGLALSIACAASATDTAMSEATTGAKAPSARSSASLAPADHARTASALRAAYASLREGGVRSPFDQPLHLASTQAAQSVRGDIHAELSHPFRAVSEALGRRQNWCQILILHPNVKKCAIDDDAGRSIGIAVGSGEVPMEFGFRVAAATADYLRVELGAASGPLGTSDYRLMLEAAPLDDRRTLVHFAYSYAYGAQARLAMQAYLGTLGRGKEGFTIAGRDSDGRPVRIDGLRGALERNAMRYHLAIDAFLDSLGAPPPQRPERALQAWLAAISRYPQLHEEEGYAERKRAEIQRQREAS
jgi:hypothetical protein